MEGWEWYRVSGEGMFGKKKKQSGPDPSVQKLVGFYV